MNAIALTYTNKKNAQLILDGNDNLFQRIVPCPTIQIIPEIYYVNDEPVGYTYSVTLNGFANSLRKDLNPGSVDYGLDKTLTHIQYIQDIFSFNGGDLIIKNLEDPTNLIVAKGATIKSFNINESSNHWVNYAPYTIELEFNEIDFSGCHNTDTLLCNDSILKKYGGNTGDLIKTEEYRIKDFSDSWSINVDEEFYDIIPDDNTIQNSTFKVSYNINATGKHYYQEDPNDDEKSVLIPAWHQARNFVQDKLYTEVSLLIGNINNGILLSSSLDGKYEIFNEIITCETSETNGTFSLTYTAIIKYIVDDSSYATHTITKNISVTDESQYNTTVSVQGTIQGLILGGFIKNPGTYSLPQNGTFIAYNSEYIGNKYYNALRFYKQHILDDSDEYNLNSNIVSKIFNNDLAIKGEPLTNKPISFNVDHNYHEGSITYSATYDSNFSRTYGRGYTNISITRDDPVDIVQEFIVPGRAEGPIIQKLNMKSSKKVSVSINGAVDQNKNYDHLSNLGVCGTLPSIPATLGSIIAEEDAGMCIKTKDDRTINTIDGSFSFSLEYTYYNPTQN